MARNPNELANELLKEGKKAWELDKAKYPDVEETPYGFIYNVGGRSITDLGGERKKRFPNKYDESKQYGFSVERDGDEYFYPTFEDAYKAAKRR